MTAAYLDLSRGEPSTPAGGEYWLARLPTTLRTSVALALATSQEELETRIQAFYQRHLHRAGHGGGVSYWNSALHDPLRDGEVVAELLGRRITTREPSPTDLPAARAERQLARACAAGSAAALTTRSRPPALAE